MTLGYYNSYQCTRILTIMCIGHQRTLHVSVQHANSTELDQWPNLSE